jgi:hypothetical protein
MHHDARRTVGVGVLLVVALVGRGLQAQDKPPAPAPALGPDRLAAIDRISTDSLKGHLSFLASDLLEGRDTPSKGLDLAAEYIAAQFRRAGLEAVGDDGYFQTANWEYSEPDPSKYKFEIASNGETFSIASDHIVTYLPRLALLDIPPTSTYIIKLKDVADLDLEKVVGKIVVVLHSQPGTEPALAETLLFGQMMQKLNHSKAAMILVTSKKARPVIEAILPGRTGGRLFDPQDPTPGRSEQAGPPEITVHDLKISKLFEDLPEGSNPATVTLHGAATTRPVKLKNVVGLLRGSDPVLKDTCVMVTAHYDHIGVRGAEGTDRIFNGANDDGSGTVSVVEIASALATLKERPKRSILFVTFFGEEKGLLGSRYYGKHPLFPIDKTIADVNLEQVGRTDDSEGPQLARASLTGFGYSGVSTAFVVAGEAEGVKVVKHPRNSDAYFGRSDNQALADLGVPAHTLCVAFQYPDYHGAADHWDKVDYVNMTKIDRMVARALLTLADDTEEPKWDESNPRAAKYLKAWKERRGK